MGKEIPTITPPTFIHIHLNIYSFNLLHALAFEDSQLLSFICRNVKHTDITTSTQLHKEKLANIHMHTHSRGMES